MPISTRCQAGDWWIDFKIFIRFFDVYGILRVNEKLVDEVLVEDPLGAISLRSASSLKFVSHRKKQADNANSSTKTSILRMHFTLSSKKVMMSTSFSNKLKSI